MRDFFSVQGVFKTRNLVVMALLVAMKVVLGQLSIYITPTFQIVSLAYLPGAMVAILYGPWAAIIFGFVADTAGYFARPVGPFFLGYAISEMVRYFLYACFLYKKPLRIWRVLAAQILILVTVTMGLNFLWNVILYGAVASKYFTGIRIVNNLIQLPIRVFLVIMVGQLVRRLEQQRFAQ